MLPPASIVETPTPNDTPSGRPEPAAGVAAPERPKMKVHRAGEPGADVPAAQAGGGGGAGGGGRPPMTLYTAEPERRRRRRWPWVVGSIAAVVVIGVLAVLGYGYWYVNDTVSVMTHATDKKQAEAQNGLAVAAANEPITALIIGEDRRPGENVSRSDTMMLVRLDPRTKSMSMLSFPRDLVVSVPGYGRRPINEAFELGAEPLALATVKELTGVQINYLVPVNFRAFTRMVGTFGGVWVPVDRRYYNVNDGTPEHNYMSINIQPGYQLLRGVDALAFARFRHMDSDLIRMARQQTFVREFKKRVDRWGMASRLIEVISILRDNIRILGSNKRPIDATTLLEYGRLLSSIPRGNLQQVRLDDIASSTRYPGKLEASPQAVQAAVDKFLNPDLTSGNLIASRDVAKDPKQKAKKPTYDPAKVGVEVRNGNGTPAAAADASWQLVEAGWKQAHSAGDSLAQYLHTTIYFDASIAGAKDAANSIGESFGSDSEVKPIDAAAKAEIQQNGIDIKEPVVVVLGKTYTGDLAPPKVAALPPKEEAQINRDPTRDLAMWRQAQRKAGFPLWMPTVVYAGAETRDPQFSSQPPYRVYKTGGHKAVYVTYAADAYDQVFGVQAIQWDNPPILDGPSTTRSYKGRTLLLYFNGPNLQRVAWKQDGISYWLENSLTGRIPNSAMIAMAKSFKLVTR